jgi:hypothetical protein
VILIGFMTCISHMKNNNLCMCIELCTLMDLALIFVLLCWLLQFVGPVDFSATLFCVIDLVGLAIEQIVMCLNSIVVSSKLMFHVLILYD